VVITYNVRTHHHWESKENAMAIRARVGRHHKTGGRNCQNWADDQSTVVSLLNQIPRNLGGAGGQLKPRIVAGIASDDLYAAILRFEDQHFPGQRSGFIDPGGPMYQRLQSLANAALPPNEPEPPQPTAIDYMLEKAEKLIGNPNQFAVTSFLTRLKKDGYEKPIQNPTILAYCWGHFRFVQGNGSALPPQIHTATPYYRGNVIKPSKNSHIVIMTNSTLASVVNGKLEYIRTVKVTLGKVVLDEPQVTLGNVILDDLKVTVGPVVLEK
jgi:hypothetical protein